MGKRAKPAIAIVGAGNVGSALALAFHRRGFSVTDIIVRDLPESRRRGKQLAMKVRAKLTTIGYGHCSADAIWICVTDDAIASVAKTLAKSGIAWKGKTVFHTSAALTSDLMRPLKRKGAVVASAHPMMTFVRNASPGLAGVSFALEGDSVAIKRASDMVSALGGVPFKLRKQAKVLYHVLGSFASPMVIATLAMAEQVGKKTGLKADEVRRIIRPILERTIRNFLDHGAVGAFSGPINRGDTRTVQRHMKELRKVPQARNVYRTLALAVMAALPVKNRKELERAINS